MVQIVFETVKLKREGVLGTRRADASLLLLADKKSLLVYEAIMKTACRQMSHLFLSERSDSVA